MTKRLDWKEEWTTGIPEVDVMHREIADKLNQLIDIFSSPAETQELRAPLKQRLSELQTMARDHFVAEEQAMRRFHYPDYSNHKRDHTILIAEMSQLIREIDNNDLTKKTRKSLQRDLKNWFVAHTIIADKAFADFYHSQGEGDYVFDEG